MVNESSFVGAKFSSGDKMYEVKFGDDFYYEDPIDGSIAKQQVNDAFVDSSKTAWKRLLSITI